jgi:hypothetical protein
MVHVLATTGVLAVGVVVLVVFQRRFAAFERRYMWAGFGAHVVAAFGQVLITRYYYGGGDMLSYHESGQQLAEWLRADFPAHAVELTWVFLQQSDSFVAPGIVVHGVGGATGSMFAGAGFSSLVTGGSLYAICLMWSLFAFAGQVGLYMGFRAVFRPLLYRRLLVAALLVPTVVFWSGGMLKEAAALGGFGLVFLGVQRLIYGGYRPRYLCLAVFGAVFVGLFKPYILFPFVLAAGIWFYWYRSMEDRDGVGLVAKPLYLIVGVCVALGAVVVFGELFPQYAPGQLGEKLASTRYHQLRAGGGSRIEMMPTGGRSLIGQLPLVPLALATVLLRPFIFEVHNAVALVNALETTAILGLVVWILVGRGLSNVYRTVGRSPAAVFCVLFTVLFGAAVGLAAPNLGTLSRYRIPMMPFYLALLLVLAPVGSASS